MTIARGAPVLAASAALAALAAPAAADQLLATRGQPLDEISHTVTVRIADGVATYTVQRRFQNRGRIADEARLAIDLPTGAAATGLRIRAGGAWHAGELLDREVAADRYRQLTGAGVYDPKDPALLFWISPSELYLQIFPVAPGGVSTVEYTLTAPTRYAAGRYWLTYPRADRGAATATADRLPDPEARRLVDPVVAVVPDWTPPAGGLAIDGRPAQPGAPVALAPPAQPTWRLAAAAATPAPPAAATAPPAAAAPADPDADPGADPDADLPYAAGAIDVPAAPRGDLRYSLARIHVELQHPSPGELALALVTPAGALVPITDGASAPHAAAVSAHEVRLPEPTRAAGRWRLLVRSRASDETGALLAWSLTLADRTFASADAPAFIPAGADGPRRALIAVAPPAAPGPAAPWTGRLGRAIASPASAFSLLELDAAPRLSALPRRPQVVFVLDASYSVGPSLLEAQLAIVRAYLAHVPDAEVELIAVRRAARRVFGRFVPAAAAPRLLDDAVRAGALALGNGSALDEGARLAAALLAGRPAPQRLVLATDELVRSALTAPDALAALAQLPPAAVVHVVVPRAEAGAAPALERDDDAALAPLATRHHGILARLSGVTTPATGTGTAPATALAPAAALAPVILELVRPTRIDDLAAAGPSPHSLPDTLREGEGLRLLTAAPATDAPAALALTGKLWSEPVRLDLTASPALDAPTAAFVFGADQHGGLTDEEQRTLARAARAVSPVTSYLAIEPGVRPSRVGLDDELLAGRYGTIGTGSFGTASRCGFHITRHVDLAPLIPTAACARQHAAGAPWSVKLQLELTRDEIVDVAVVDGAGPLADCLAEAAWSVRLPAHLDLERDTRTLVLSGP